MTTRTSAALSVLQHATSPALLFAAPLLDDDASVLDLRATDLPVSDVMLRNEARRRWRERKRLVVRIDEAPTAQIVALLLELSRREVRLSADAVDRFADDHNVVVRTTAAVPPASLVRFFPIRVRAVSSTTAHTPPAPPAPQKPPKAIGRTNAGRR